MLSICVLGISVIISGVSGLSLEIKGVDSCKSLDTYSSTQNCTYNYDDKTLAEKSIISISVVLCSKKQYSYNLTCAADAPRILTFTYQHYDGNKYCGTETYEFPLKEENETVLCQAAQIGDNGNGNPFKAEIHLLYHPPPPTEPPTTPTEPATTVTTISPLQETPSTRSGQQLTDATVSSPNDDDSSSNGWVKWAVLGGVLFLAVCTLTGFIIKYRQKKRQPPDATYANLAKDQSTYQTMPVPAPRSCQANSKPKVTVENNYSEPKDSQDMSDALYADPKRFNGESDTYAEPYVKKTKSDYAEPYAKSNIEPGSMSGTYAEPGPKSGTYAEPGPKSGTYANSGSKSDTYVQPYAKSVPKSDTYAEPYKSDYAEPYAAEGNYAELNIGSGKELYAKPIPKAQRKKKEKDDMNYSNVFGGNYGNTKK